ncbi:MAG: septum formation initiator family protein [Patescibacteria group bacterium]|mgnify:CR=1 FL=1
MKIIIVIIIVIVIIMVLAYVYFSFQEQRQMKENLSNLNAQIKTLVGENDELKSEIEYFSHPENLEKELKTKFNYRKPDEKMMIIVP